MSCFLCFWCCFSVLTTLSFMFYRWGLICHLLWLLFFLLSVAIYSGFWVLWVLIIWTRWEKGTCWGWRLGRGVCSFFVLWSLGIGSFRISTTLKFIAKFDLFACSVPFMLSTPCFFRLMPDIINCVLKIAAHSIKISVSFIKYPHHFG